MIRIAEKLTASQLLPRLERFWDLSAGKIRSIETTCPPGKPSPVFTVKGRYTARGWTEWTQGFQYGSSLLQFDATGDQEFLDLGQARTLASMPVHVTNFGVHDHGFNNVSTYGNLWRLIKEGKAIVPAGQRDLCELALKVSGAVQARRWAMTNEGVGYIYSFNGPQSLFIDTIRSCRALAVAHLLGHVMMGERDQKISLLDRLVEHAICTAKWNVYYGEGRDYYDVRGRVAHESIFNVNNGDYRCPNSQQGYSPFTTWTRGLGWAMLGFAEELEYLDVLPDAVFKDYGGRARLEAVFLKAASATCDFYIDNTPTDGIPYLDAGAPGLSSIKRYLDRPADPFNAFEPVDSSAATIAAQGLLRLGHFLAKRGKKKAAARYWQAGLTVSRSLFDEPYLSTDRKHQGLILHSVYHRPNGWDYIPRGQKVPCGESSQWGDYHARELAVYLGRVARGQTYMTFFGGGQ